MISNNKISTLVNSQVPFFVRNDHENFVLFLEAYYEWLEQANNTVNVAKSMRDQLDVDKADLFLQDFYDQFLPMIPENVLVDRTLLVKHIKDFYTARGSEKSVRFLMRILFNETPDFYYPQRDILKASDGKWFVEKSIKIQDITVDNVANSMASVIQKFIGRKIFGATSNSNALVENVDSYYDNGELVKELKISQQQRDFVSGESIYATFTENGVQKTIRANLFSGAINTVTITNPGSGYAIGDSVGIESNTGSGGIIIVSSVSLGEISSIAVIEGGAGFQVNNAIAITGGGGSGANAKVLTVNTDGLTHPNTYNISYTTISVEANTLLSNAVYSNLNSTNANVAIANALSYFTYANTGPIDSVLLISGGTSFTSEPLITAQANTRVLSLGILGKLRIVNGGTGYNVNDEIQITNVVGGYGIGAKARVKNVNTSAANAISAVEFVQVSGHIIGGSGYDMNFLPIANVVSANANASGANIAVTAILGAGEILASEGSTAGAIQELTIVSRGSNYETAPTLNLTSYGDGTAQAIATIITGSFTYPGRYINDDGHLSSYNFIQDRDYYQKYSYVVKTHQTIEKYRIALKNLIHPAGMKLFGEYMHTDNAEGGHSSLSNIHVNMWTFSTKNYSHVNANVTIAYTSHGLSQNNIVYLDWYTGNLVTSNATEGPYAVSNVINANAFSIVVAGTYQPTGSGTVNVGKTFVI